MNHRTYTIIGIVIVVLMLMASAAALTFMYQAAKHQGATAGQVIGVGK